MKLAIIANPISGGGRVFRQVEGLLRSWPHPDWEVALYPTKCPEHAGLLARELCNNPPDLLAVCGGDGTLNEVIASVPAPPFPVALIPAGTANVLARELGLPRDPAQSLAIALKRVVRNVDLGIVRGRHPHPFLLMAGIGVDAYIVSLIRPKKRRFGIATFYLASLRALLRYSFPEFRVLIGSENLPATSCLISNSRSYGGGLVFTPNADMADGMFDILILQGKPGLGHARFMLSAWLGRPRPVPCVQWRRASDLRAEGARGIWVQVDGELAGTIPIDVTLESRAFPLVVRG